jgi:hypothetical protein
VGEMPVPRFWQLQENGFFEKVIHSSATDTLCIPYFFTGRDDEDTLKDFLWSMWRKKALRGRMPDRKERTIPRSELAMSADRLTPCVCGTAIVPVKIVHDGSVDFEDDVREPQYVGYAFILYFPSTKEVLWFQPVKGKEVNHALPAWEMLTTSEKTTDILYYEPWKFRFRVNEPRNKWIVEHNKIVVMHLNDVSARHIIIKFALKTFQDML